MKTIAVKGTLRPDLGKKSTKALRNAGLVPCVVYGGENNVHFSAPAQDFRDLIYTNEFRVAEIEVEGKKYKAIIKATQFHPITDTLLHIDLLELVEGKAVKTELPLRLVGQPSGVKEGGVLIQKIRKLNIKTTPDKLSPAIEVNVDHLTLGKSIRIREVQVQEGIEIMNSGGIPIASVEVPRALRSADAAVEAEVEEEVEAEA